MTDTIDLSLETRAFAFRAQSVDTEKRTVTGIAVPFDVDANIAGYYLERFAPGSVQDSSDALMFWRHADPIGRLTADGDTDAGWQITARVSDTTLGNDALTLARDGVVTQLSVGFEPGGEYEVEERDGELPIITRTKVRVREVSLVPFGAYADAASVSEVRARITTNPATKEHTMTDPTTEAPDLLDIRSAIEELERRFDTFRIVPAEEETVTETRSAAEIVKAIVAGDADTIASVSEVMTLNRAYTGGTSADSPVKPGWVGDLTRIFDNSSGVLASLFRSAALPATGMSVEYAQLLSDTTQVAEQVNEGDDLVYGKVTLETKNAPVKTFGGYTQLSRQEIERSTLPILQRSLEALGLAAGKRQKLALRAAFNSVVSSQTAIASNGGVVLLGSTLTAATYNNFVSAIVDAAVKYDGNALTMDELIVSATVFKKLASLNGSDGRPMLSLDGSGANTVGRLNITALNGSLAGVPVVLDASQTGDSAVFADARAITVYTTPVVSLQDDNIINLSKDFSVYRYAAFAPEIPAGIVPLKLAAS